MNNLDNNKVLVLIFVSSFLFKLTAAYFFNFSFNDAWEWTVIYESYSKNTLYSYFITEEGIIKHSNYMPLLFSILTYPIIQISPFLFIFLQIILNTLSSFLLYLITKKFFNTEVAIVFLFIFSFFPLNVYSSIKFTNINIFIFLFSSYLLILLNLFEKKINFYDLLFFNLCSVLCILVRSEFILISLFSFIYLFYFKIINLKKIIISFFIIFLIFSPLILRNLHTHGHLIFTAKSLGINLWRAWHKPNVSNSKNINSIKNNGTSYLLSKKVNDKILELPIHNWETNLNKIYFDQAVLDIKKNILYVPIIFIQRIFSQLFWFVNHDYPKANHFLIVIPWLFIIINFFQYSFRNFRKVFFNKRRHVQRLIYFYFFYYIVLFSCLFVIPRYKLFLLPLVCIFASENIHYLYRKYILRK